MNTHTKSYSRLLVGALVMLIAAAMTSVAAAEEVKFKLSGDNEVPPVGTRATGDAAITIMPDMSVSGTVMTAGVLGTMAHIHGGPPGANGPVLITLERKGDNGWTVPAGAKLTQDQYGLYRTGGLYINVHSADHKGGEIRGQMK